MRPPPVMVGPGNLKISQFAQASCWMRPSILRRKMQGWLRRRDCLRPRAVGEVHGLGGTPWPGLDQKTLG
jgi:hypothetical protein